MIYRASISIAGSLGSWAIAALVVGLAMTHVGSEELAINLTRQWFFDVAYALGLLFVGFFVFSIVVLIVSDLIEIRLK